MELEASAGTKTKWARSHLLWIIVIVVIVVVFAGICIAVGVYLGSDKDDSPAKDLSNKTALILGAGASGLVAGQRLHERGVKIKILEAFSQIGGRVRTHTIGDIKVEIGANIIYGSTPENIVKKRATALNLKTAPANFNTYKVYDERGKDITAAFDATESSLLATIQKFIGVANQGKDMSLRDALKSLGWTGSSAIQQLVEIWNIEFEEPLRLDRLSLQASVSDDSFEASSSNFCKDQRGYVTILEDVADQYLKKNDSRLLLNTVVKTIEYSSSGVKVTTSGGDVHEADFAIMTFPIGVLQNNDVTFTPSLPTWKKSSISKTVMGKYLHVYLKFDRTFWDDTQWILHASSKRRHYPIICSWDKLQPVPSIPKKHMLFFVIVEEEAERISKMALQDLQNEMMTVLRNIYGQNIPDPLSIYRPPWVSDPLFRGSYTVRPMGFTRDDVINLRSPVDRLYFAGEAMVDSGEGFVHGAWDSGDATAKAVMACMEGNCVKRY